MAIVSLEGKWLRVNRRLGEMLGYPPEDLLAGGFRNLTHPDDLADDLAAARALAAGERETYSKEKRYIRKDGATVWVSLSVGLVRDDAGRPAYFVSVADDITERRRMAEALAVSRERLDNIINASGDPIFVKDEASRFVLVNDALCGMLGMRREDIVGKTLGESLPADEMEHFLAVDKAVLATGEENLSEESLTGKGGVVLTIVTRKTRYVSRQGRVFLVGVIRDVTEGRKLEVRLEQSRKMEAVGTLAGGIAHEFNNLLTVITVYTGLLLGEIKLEGPIRQRLERIRTSADRAAGLVNHLLAFSRKSVIQPRLVALGEAVAGMQGNLRSLAGPAVEVAVKVDPAAGSVMADPRQVEQVVTSLVANARDAMPGGGRLSVEVSNAEVTGSEAGIRLAADPGPCVMLAVADNGTGMDEATQARIFDPFFSTKGVGAGSGLGLSAVFGIVQQAGGGIALTSAPGQGSTFRVYLPRVPVAAAPVAG